MQPTSVEVGLYIFILAGFLGYHVISRVPPLLHTPLMSATNAISGISLIGSLVIAGAGPPISHVNAHCPSHDPQAGGRVDERNGLALVILLLVRGRLLQQLCNRTSVELIVTMVDTQDKDLGHSDTTATVATVAQL
jgi:4TM region of pyridine nucleotide transhydrogenase, mitoch